MTATEQSTEQGYDVLRAEIDALRAELAAFRATLATEVRTRRLVVEDEAGVECIYSRHTADGWSWIVELNADGGSDRRQVSAALFAVEPGDDEWCAGLSLVGAGDVRGGMTVVNRHVGGEPEVHGEIRLERLQGKSDRFVEIEPDSVVAGVGPMSVDRVVDFRALNPRVGEGR